MNPDIVIAALCGGGGTGLIQIIWQIVEKRRLGKAEDAKTLGVQLEAQAIRDMNRANAAEIRADKAEEAETAERRARWAAEEYIAALRLQLKTNGIDPVEREGRQ